jgi:hypothetical protein
MRGRSYWGVTLRKVVQEPLLAGATPPPSCSLDDEDVIVIRLRNTSTSTKTLLTTCEQKNGGNLWVEMDLLKNVTREMRFLGSGVGVFLGRLLLQTASFDGQATCRTTPYSLQDGNPAATTMTSLWLRDDAVE